MLTLNKYISKPPMIKKYTMYKPKSHRTQSVICKSHRTQPIKFKKQIIQVSGIYACSYAMIKINKMIHNDVNVLILNTCILTTCMLTNKKFFWFIPLVFFLN